MSEQVRFIVERRWIDGDSGNLVSFLDAETGWVEAKLTDPLTDVVIGALVRPLIDRTRVEGE